MRRSGSAGASSFGSCRWGWIWMGCRARRTPVVGIIGRLTAVKNHDLFLRVAARFGDEVRFVVYGDGADRAALEARGTHVHFAGTRPAREIYGAIDIVALTSLNEGTPLTLIEAMANGIPV